MTKNFYLNVFLNIIFFNFPVQEKGDMVKGEDEVYIILVLIHGNVKSICMFVCIIYDQHRIICHAIVTLRAYGDRSVTSQT